MYNLQRLLRSRQTTRNDGLPHGSLRQLPDLGSFEGACPRSSLKAQADGVFGKTVGAAPSRSRLSKCFVVNLCFLGL